jgi:PAS domain S-box-containing protein
MVRACLVDAGREELVEDAELLVSEIVTNALVHAGTAIDVTCSLDDGGLRVEVGDGSPHAPSPRRYGIQAGTGRGLRLLREMVDDWGVLPGERGKTVWFQMSSEVRRSPSPELSSGLSSGLSSEPSPDDPPPVPRAAAETVAVRLLDVPLLLHEAWREHAESLLREYLLARLEPDMADDPITAHAEASDAIALLAEHVPASGVDEDPEQVLITAIQPSMTSPMVRLPVPVESVPHFATLNRLLVDALEMAEDGRLLTPPTQPEVQGLRAWLCGEVLGQSRGDEPIPWSSSLEPPARPLRGLAWDTEPVRRSPGATVAADDEGRMLAVSPHALEILRYDDAADLVGRRLVQLIPERYRQAHLAGFTMHLLTGRAPLIGHAVVVPALRRDGSEVEVELTIGVHRSADGRSVFVADLAEV